MAENTPNLNLYKGTPGSTVETFNVQTMLNDNWDKLDAEVPKKASALEDGRMSKEDKSKLDGIEASANNYTHPATHPPSVIAQDANNRFVTDTEKAAWDEAEANAIAYAVANFLKLTGGTLTGDIIAKWIGFEGGDHWITNNDGGGNFNIRIGHKYENGNTIYTADGKGAIHLNFAHENSNPYLQINISEDPTGKLAGDVVTWAKVFIIKADGTITWDGKTIYHAGNISADLIPIQDAEGHFVATDTEGALHELFTNVSDGKTSIASAITDMGQVASGGDTFATLSTKIRDISDDANAVVGEVLSGKTFYQGGAKRTGTMANKGAYNITPGATNKAIPAGYHNGSGVVYGDADLVADNIRNGKNIFGVSGSMIEGYDWENATYITDTHTNTEKNYIWLDITGSGYLTGIGFHDDNTTMYFTVQVDGGDIWYLSTSTSSGMYFFPLLLRFKQSIKVTASYTQNHVEAYLSYMID